MRWKRHKAPTPSTPRQGTQRPEQQETVHSAAKAAAMPGEVRRTLDDSTSAEAKQHTENPQKEVVDNFVSKLPKDCALVIVDQRSREHNWVGYGADDHHAKALLRSGGLTVHSIETLSDIADSLDENLAHLKSALRKKARSHLVTVTSTLGSSFTNTLEEAQIPWVHGRGKAREILLNRTPYREAIARDLVAVKEQTQRQARVTAQALYGNSDVYQRDTWKDNVRENGYFWRELVILNNRRIIQIDSTAKLGPQGDLEKAINVADLGKPKSISIEGDTTRIQTSSTQETEIVIATERGHQTVGYKNSPIVLDLEDPVGPGMLMALIELGCSQMVRH